MALQDSLRNLFPKWGATEPQNGGTRGTTAPVSSQSPSGAAYTFDPPPRCRVREKLGQGGMGAVYRALDLELGHDVALKTLARIAPEDLYHLKNEFRSLAQIRHPNLVDLYELFVDENGAFFSMELVNGTDFVRHVRRADGRRGACDFDALGDAALQLAGALAAVHAAGKLHRDVKPSNVRVSTTGRVVLLDFGLVDVLVAGAEQTRASGSLVGTIDYMAPEQARGEALTPAADWYGFGASLFEAITGEPPLDKALPWLLGYDQARGPRSVNELVPSVPPEMERLVTELLARSPAERPSGADVVRRLSGTPEGPSGETRPPATASARVSLEGRDDETRVLRTAFERAPEEGAIVHVHGPSGIGKSELIRRFVEGAEEQGALVLRGRCHPQESVPFNALDGIIDQLSHHLAALPPETLSSLLPRGADALVRVFPVMGRVAHAGVPSAFVHPEAEHESRKRAADALRVLLAGLSSRSPLILWLDDVQWGDEDSGRILTSLLSPADAPRALTILSYRTEDRRESKMLGALAGFIEEAKSRSNEVELRPLSAEQTSRIVSQLLGAGFDADASDLDRLASESGGLPFFAHELARFLMRVEPRSATAASPTLKDMLGTRLRALTEDARQFVEVVSVAGAPMELRQVLSASGTKSSARSLVHTLERECLVRTTAVGAERCVEIYHHRIRESVLDGLGEPRRRVLHGAVANAMLSVQEPNLPLVVEHYEAAQDLDAVRKYVVSAARQAAKVLAFGRAADLYRRAIEVNSTEVDAVELRYRLGRVLAEAGRSREAGESFEAAGELCARAESGQDRLLLLQNAAADQYLQSGQWARASEALKPVLTRFGIRAPESTSSAVLHLLANRTRTSWMIRRPVSSDVPANGILVDRADLLLKLTQVIGYRDILSGMVFSSQLLLDALQCGDARIAMMGLSSECVSLASCPGEFARKQSERMLEMYEQLLPRGGVFHRAGFLVTRGMARWMWGDFQSALESLDQAVPETRIARRDVSFQLAGIHGFQLPALAHLGRLARLGAEIEPLLTSAEARGDNYTLAIAAMGHQCLAWLAADEPGRVLYWRERVLAVLPSKFTVSSQMCLIGAVLVDLYRGEGQAALERVEAFWPELRRNFILTVPYFGEDLLQLRARTLLAAAEQIGPGSRSRKLCRRALEDARALEKMPFTYAPAHADLIRAGAARLAGDAAGLVTALKRALPAFEEAHLDLYACCARLALSETTATHPDHRRRADAWMAAEGVKRPLALARVMAPGCFGFRAGSPDLGRK